MNTLIEQIKKGQERASEVFMNYEKKIVDEHPLDWQKQFLISLLEGERGRKVERKKLFDLSSSGTTESSMFARGVSSILRDDISHIDEALSFLKTNV